MTIYVIGHTCPDSDAIISAITTAELLKLKGMDAIAVKQGDINPETQFILNKFNLKEPETITSVEGKDIAIVDTTELTQLPNDIDKANIIFIADHHKLGGIKTPKPLEVNIKPVGCTATVLYDLFKNENFNIPKNIAGAMICAIMSDTVIFKSPTTTEFDKSTVTALAKIADIKDPLALGLEMIKVKSSIENDTVENLLYRDFKNFDINGKKFGVGQIELIDGNMINPKKSDLIDFMKKEFKTNNYHTIMLLITDIMKEGSEVIAISQEIEKLENIYNIKFNKENSAWISGMMSRKKQVLPPILENFEQ